MAVGSMYIRPAVFYYGRNCTAHFRSVLTFQNLYLVEQNLKLFRKRGVSFRKPQTKNCIAPPGFAILTGMATLERRGTLNLAETHREPTCQDALSRNDRARLGCTAIKKCQGMNFRLLSVRLLYRPVRKSRRDLVTKFLSREKKNNFKARFNFLRENLQTELKS